MLEISLVHMRICLAALIVALASTYYTYENRYYLRYLPLPVSMVGLLYQDDTALPTYKRYDFLGSAPFRAGDITTEEGLRNTLSRLQSFSPPHRSGQVSSYADITFDKWMSNIQRQSFYCTDASQLFMMLAKQQGLRAREWQLLEQDWEPGQGHSLVEFYNPQREAWQLIDAQQAVIFRSERAETASMQDVLQDYTGARSGRIILDRGQYSQDDMARLRGGTTEQYLYKNDLLRTPVLQLLQPTWLASRPTGLSNINLILGYPVFGAEWTHDTRVITSKISALLGLVSGIVFVVTLFKRRRKKIFS